MITCLFFKIIGVLFVTIFYIEFVRVSFCFVFLPKVLNVLLIEEEWSAKCRSHLVNVFQVEKSRWVTAALFGPVGKPGKRCHNAARTDMVGSSPSKLPQTLCSVGGWFKRTRGLSVTKIPSTVKTLIKTLTKEKKDPSGHV